MAEWTVESLTYYSELFDDLMRVINIEDAKNTYRSRFFPEAPLHFQKHGILAEWSRLHTENGIPDLGIPYDSLNYYLVLAPGQQENILKWRSFSGTGIADLAMAARIRTRALAEPNTPIERIIEKERGIRTQEVEAAAAAKEFRSAEQLRLEEIYRLPFSEIEKKSEEELKEMVTEKVTEAVKTTKDAEIINQFSTVEDAIKSGRLSDAAIRILVKAEQAKSARLEREQEDAMLIAIQREREIAAKTIADILNPAQAAADRREEEIAANLKGAMDIIRRAKEQEDAITAGILRRAAAAKETDRDFEKEAGFIGAPSPEPTIEIPRTLDSFVRYLGGLGQTLEETRIFTALTTEKTLESFDRIIKNLTKTDMHTLKSIQEQEKLIEELQGSDYAKIYEESQKLRAGGK